jgi:PiT family inorganic phosphate transporter
MSSVLILVTIIVASALIFDFLNGFHDAANTIATIVVTRTLSPLTAVLLAGAANFIGYFTFGTAVAKTIGMGVVHLDMASLTATLPLRLILAALIGASLWNITTWILGLPTSSSHALIGGLIGAAVTAIGIKAIIFGGVLKIFLFIFIAPVLGFAGAYMVTILARWTGRPFRPSRINPVFKYLQIISSIAASIGHGTNDAQKSMGIIALTLFAAHLTPSFQLKPWIVMACYCAISLGTAFGGWRIVRTMGTQITKIGPAEGFCSGAAASGVLFFATHLGIPVSTTHVISGSIMGVGSVGSIGKVRWITARKIVWAWFMTIPIAAGFAALTYYALSTFYPGR